jgi:sulfite exporter TauE/SafE
MVNRSNNKLLKYTGLAFLFIGLYIALSNVPLFSGPTVSLNGGLLLIFLTGLLTSLHCVGMCGGFVLAYSAGSSEISRMGRVRQHFSYNVSRLVSYTSLGAIAGLVGSIFLLTAQFRGYLSIIAGAYMILYGLSTFFPIMKRVTMLRTPNTAKYAKSRGPIIVGLLSGMMPCGPLQAMLIYAASTGSPLQGASVMFAFVLGTIPLMFGFGNAISLLTRKYLGRVMVISAVILMALGLVTMNRGLINSGYETPLLNPLLSLNLFGSNNVSVSTIQEGFQEINMTVSNHMYNPDSFTVQRDIPVRMNIIIGKTSDSVMGIRIPSFGISKDFNSDNETVTLEFTPTEVGTINFICPMGIKKGEIIVK